MQADNNPGAESECVTPSMQGKDTADSRRLSTYRRMYQGSRLEDVDSLLD